MFFNVNIEVGLLINTFIYLPRYIKDHKHENYSLKV
jgi:hypothetical protein